MGIFLAGCFLFNFITLIEYSVASYLDRKRTRKPELLLPFRQETPSNMSSKKSSATEAPNLFQSRNGMSTVLYSNI